MTVPYVFLKDMLCVSVVLNLYDVSSYVSDIAQRRELVILKG